MTEVSLIDPAVRAGRRFVLVLVNVNIEALAVALVLPVRDAIAQAVQKGSTPQINIPNKHSPEMAEVAHLVVSHTERAEKRQSRHDRNNRAHAHRHGDREKINAPVRK